MCSFITQIVYGAVTLAILALTAASIFKDDWIRVDDQNSGLLCNIKHVLSTGNTTNSIFCDGWWKMLQPWQKVVVVFMFLAIIFEILAFVYNLFTLCACCCKKYIIHPLSAFSLLVVVFLAVAVIVYAINNSDAARQVQDLTGVGIGINKTVEQAMGSSFIMAALALGLALINTVLASLAICFAEKCM